ASASSAAAYTSAVACLEISPPGSSAMVTVHCPEIGRPVSRLCSRAMDGTTYRQSSPTAMAVVSSSPARSVPGCQRSIRVTATRPQSQMAAITSQRRSVSAGVMVWSAMGGLLPVAGVGGSGVLDDAGHVLDAQQDVGVRVGGLSRTLV